MALGGSFYKSVVWANACCCYTPCPRLKHESSSCTSFVSRAVFRARLCALPAAPRLARDCGRFLRPLPESTNNGRNRQVSNRACCWNIQCQPVEYGTVPYTITMTDIVYSNTYNRTNTQEAPYVVSLQSMYDDSIGASLCSCLGPFMLFVRVPRDTHALSHPHSTTIYLSCLYFRGLV